MKQDLPNLVDERRFRRREPEQFERDEFGRVKLTASAPNQLTCSSENGPRRRFLLIWSPFQASTCALKLSVPVELT
jgi:hypothetical protein